MKEELNDILRKTIEKCFEDGTLTQGPLPDYVIEVPNNPEHGHYATNVPLTLAATQKRPPRDIAKIIVDQWSDNQRLIEKAEIAGPGFINFTIASRAWYDVLSKILVLENEYGRSRLGQGERVLVEFVSANPTGPLHLGHGRGAALGDSLCRILAFAGYEVVREFYVNDAGRQVRSLGESIYSRWRQLTEPEYPFPPDGYHGEYIGALAEEVASETDLTTLTAEEAIAHCALHGKEKMLAEIRRDLARFRISFDVWYSETDLHTSGLLQRDLDKVKETGHMYEKDGALWIRTSRFGDDKDRVIRKNDGHYTYFASDISYHLEKWKRGFSSAVNIWGADHHGYVQRVQAALRADGVDEDWLSVLLIQLVKLYAAGREIKMSKRAGQYVTLNELVDEVGVDAARFVFLTKNHDSPIDFDIDLAKRHDSDNPVYYVQYAHARICSLFRKAAATGHSLPAQSDRVVTRLVLEEELALIRMIAEFPNLIQEAARMLEPHRVTYFLTELAASFHRYFNLGTKVPQNRIVTNDKALTEARLCLVAAIRIVLRNGLDLLGVSAPQRM
jgi:arginyl-tRNA synthetase